ncbi:MAG: thioredoxin family protein [Flavobacteriales bacterium]|nr:thioredoxin family protein [Flavobacteriales bacterium]
MALTPSNPFPTGTIAPTFILPDTISGNNLSLAELKGKKGTVIMFICNHCPFVVHVNEELVRLANDFQDKGIAFIAISSNDINDYPQDAPQYMKAAAESLGYPFPYLYDESQATAKAYDAACTPDFYIFDEELKSVYHGQLDNSRPGNGLAVTGESFRIAIDTLLKGEKPLEHQLPSIGCGIKWK